MKSKSVIGLLVLAIVVVASVIIGFQYGGLKLTMLSATTINIDQQGGLVGNKLTGTYWSIVMTTDFTDAVGAYTFDDTAAHASGSSAWWQGKNVTVLNKIRVEIDPGRPYYERPMQLKSVLVVPKAYKQTNFVVGGLQRDTSVFANELYTGSWQTITSDWILHTPFTVRVYVNGTLFGEKLIDEIGAVTTDTIGLGKDLTIGSGSQYFTITKLGALGTGYTIPIWPGVVWFNNQYFYLNSEAVQKAINCPYPYPQGGGAGIMTAGTYEDSFAYYWYGGKYDITISPIGTYTFDYHNYWGEDGTPWILASAGGFERGIPYTQSPGWDDAGGGWNIYDNRKPSVSTPPRFPTDLKPSGKSAMPLSLVEFLEQRTKAQKPLMPTWEPNVNNVVFTQTDAQNGYLRVYLPWNSFSNLIDIRISSELANTIVWEPQVANIKIADCPSDVGSIGERKTVSLTLKQTSTVASDGYVKLVPITQTLYWSFQPPTFGTGQMIPDESKTFTFDVVNLGQPTDTAFQFKVEIYNSLGQLTDSKTVTGTLLARGQQGSVLVVRTIDKDTKIDVSGIHVIVNYDTLSKEGWTSGGAVSFDFGGGTPIVTISTVETTMYKSATASKALSVGQNEITIELLKQGEPEPIDWTWLIFAVLITVVIAVVAVIVTKRKGRR